MLHLDKTALRINLSLMSNSPASPLFIIINTVVIVAGAIAGMWLVERYPLTGDSKSDMLIGVSAGGVVAMFILGRLRAHYDKRKKRENYYV